jgi:parallel beta-helix repeat protein
MTADDVLISGFTVQNCSHRTAHWAYGSIHLVQSRLSTISGNIITRNKCNGIVLDYSDNNEILDNIITFNWGSIDGDLAGGQGISLVYSNWNKITGNIVAGSVSGGIGLYEYSYANSIQENVIEGNGWAGVELDSSPLNTFHHNSFFRNEGSVFLIDSSDNVWDDGAEGNCWDDYVGLDDGSSGRVAGDGVGDTDLPHQGVDNYPLVQPPEPIPVLWENNAYSVPVYSNSTVSAFRFVQPDKTVAFSVRGPSNTTGYFKLDIPKALLSDNPWKVLLNNTDATSQAIITQNQTYMSMLCRYSHDSSYEVQIIGTSVIPEFSAQTALTLILLLTFVLAATSNKRKSSTRCRSIRKAHALIFPHHSKTNIL